MFGDGDKKEWSIFNGKDSKKDKKKDSKKKDLKKKDSKKKDSKAKDSKKKTKKPEETKNGFQKPRFTQPKQQETKKVPIILGYKDAFAYDKKNTFEVHYKNQKVSGVFIRSSKTNMVRVKDSMYLNDVIKDMDAESTASEIKENTKFYPVQLQITGVNRLLTNKE